MKNQKSETFENSFKLNTWLKQEFEKKYNFFFLNWGKYYI